MLTWAHADVCRSRVQGRSVDRVDGCVIIHHWFVLRSCLAFVHDREGTCVSCLPPSSSLCTGFAFEPVPSLPDASTRMGRAATAAGAAGGGGFLLIVIVVIAVLSARRRRRGQCRSRVCTHAPFCACVNLFRFRKGFATRSYHDVGEGRCPRSLCPCHQLHAHPATLRRWERARARHHQSVLQRGRRGVWARPHGRRRRQEARGACVDGRFIARETDRERDRAHELVILP